MKFGYLTVVTLCLMSAFGCSSEKTPVYKDASADIEARVNDLLGRMTLEEKILQLNQLVLGVPLWDLNPSARQPAFNLG